MLRFSTNVVGRLHRRVICHGRRGPAIALFVAVILVIAGVVSLVIRDSRVADAPAATAVLQVRSTPIGAKVVVDGRPRGFTPTTLRLRPGPHQVSIRRDGYADATRAVSLTTGQTQSIASDLWLATPAVEHLRTVFPGTSIVDAGFLDDGRVVITIAVPPTGDRESWVIGPRGQMQQVGPPGAQPSLAISPDGRSVAYLAASQDRDQVGLVARRYDAVWFFRASDALSRRVFTLPTNASAERLVGLAWAPDGRHLLVVGQSTAGDNLVGGMSASLQTQLLWHDLELGTGADSNPTDRTLLTLPSAILPESFLWSPRGDEVAFLAQTGQATALCTIRIDGSGFRYLADVGQDRSNPPPFAPVSWAPDGQRIVYAVPTPVATLPLGWLFSSGSANAPSGTLLTADRSGDSVRPLGHVSGASPLWRADGTIVALDRQKQSDHLLLREITPDGQSQVIGHVPVSASSVYGARWDPVHRQAILAVRHASTVSQPLSTDSLTGRNVAFEFWLVRWASEDER